ncbi:MAG: cell division topological specificity factor MinE [Candidatus Eremiobacteraeota bacterium]|nr:cell division topological specificity factor MinE [Candidatus Eremiobacteraeota bacterium]
MIEFLRRLFGQRGSSATAKERLRLVLMTDHLELSPEMIETMKRDLVDVISRHVEVDRARIDVTFERQESTLAMLANIPILSVGRPSTNGDGKHEPAPSGERSAGSSKAKLSVGAKTGPAAEGQAPPKRKRRRRKKSPPAPAAAPAAT